MDAGVQVYSPFPFHPPLPASEKSSIFCGVKAHLISERPSDVKTVFLDSSKSLRRHSDRSTTKPTHK